jgi:hypothetical protein
MALRRRRARASRAALPDAALRSTDARVAARRSPTERLSAVCDCRELVDSTIRSVAATPAGGERS